MVLCCRVFHTRRFHGICEVYRFVPFDAYGRPRHLSARFDDPCCEALHVWASLRQLEEQR